MKKSNIIIVILLLLCDVIGLTKQASAEPVVVEQESLSKNETTIEIEKEKLFLKAFGKEMPSTFYPYDVLVVLDQSVSISLAVDINPFTESVRFESTVMVRFLEQNLLQQPLRQRLGTALPPTLTDDFLRELGFNIQVDMKRQKVLLDSPLSCRKKINMYLGAQPRISIVQQKGKQPISGYVNMSHSLDDARLEHVYNGQYALNLNVDDWLLQGELVYDGLNEKEATLTGGRIVKDLPDQRIRLTMGDNSSPNTDLFLEKVPLASGFQQALFGLDMTHVGQFDRITNRSSDFRYTVLVENESRVRIELNGRSIYDGRMQSGKYELQGFPFQAGRNIIVIRLRTEEGEFEEIELEHFHNPNLLREGEKEYQFVTGLPYQGIGDVTQLDPQRFTNLLYWRHGIRDQIGATMYLQTVRTSRIGGVIGEYGFGGNIASVELAYSKNILEQSGHAIRVQAYSSNANYLSEGWIIKPNYYTLSIDHRSPDFDRTLLEGELENSNVARTTISPALIWQLKQSWQVQVSGVYGYTPSLVDTKSIVVRSYYRTKQWQWLLSLERSTGVYDPELTAFLNLTWRPKYKPRDRYSYRYNSDTESHDISASVRPEDNNAMNYQMNGQYVDPQNVSLNALARYQTFGSTLTTNVIHSSNYGYRNNQVRMDYNGARTFLNATYSKVGDRDPTTTMRLDTAVAFVGNHWGISRPINESFAILYPNNEGMEDSTIIFKDGSILDNFSTAVHPFLRNYQSNDIGIQLADVPIGLDLGTQQYTAFGRLNSGHAIPVGKPGGIIMASATLLKPNGTPYGLEVGKFVCVEDPKLTVQFFTNRNGKLFVQGLKSGEYRIELLGETYADFTLTVPNDGQTPRDLGTITLQIPEMVQ